MCSVRSKVSRSSYRKAKGCFSPNPSLEGIIGHSRGSWTRHTCHVPKRSLGRHGRLAPARPPALAEQTAVPASAPLSAPSPVRLSSRPALVHARVLSMHPGPPRSCSARQTSGGHPCQVEALAPGDDQQRTQLTTAHPQKFVLHCVAVAHQLLTDPCCPATCQRH